MVPLKAICRERFEDWQRKTSSLGLHCAELTGDTEDEDAAVVQQAHLLLTTPVRAHWELRKCCRYDDTHEGHRGTC